MSFDPYTPPQSSLRDPPPKSSFPGRKSGDTNWPLALGIFGMLAWIMPIFGLPITITGLVMGIKALAESSKGPTLVAVVLCSTGLVLSLGKIALVVYLALNSDTAMPNP